MARKKRRLSPEARTELDRRYEETTRLLEERIAYHRAKLQEERGPGYRVPSLDEYEARLRSKRAAGD